MSKEPKTKKNKKKGERPPKTKMNKTILKKES